MIITLLVAIVITIANSSNFLAGVIHTKPGEVYLGTTHYWEDYFLYVSQFFQGAHGGWLTKNLYTSEITTPTILFWPNVLLGKIGGLVGLSPQTSYNISVMLLSFAVLIILSSIMQRAFPKDKIKALIAFLLAATSTSLINHIRINGQPMWYPFELWKTPNFALDRLGGVPHQTLQTLLFLLAMHTKKLPALLVLLILLTTLNPVMSALFLVAAWVSTPSFKLILPSIGFLVTAWYYNALSNQQPHIQSKLWEAADQVRTTPLFLLLSVGPVSVLGAIGAWAIRKRTKPIHLFSIALLVASYALYFSPIPRLLGVSNSRVLFPALYAAWGVLAVEGMFFWKKTYVVFLLFILLTIPTLTWEIQRKLVVKPEERVPLLYLPDNVFQAFAYLKNQRPYDDVVLANPASHMDALVPALSGHVSLTGHPFATIANENKKRQSQRFFMRTMPDEEAKAWLASQNIRYILLTQFDGDATRFHDDYPFFRTVFSTESVTIFSSHPER